MAEISRRHIIRGAVGATTTVIAAPFISKAVRAESRAYPPRDYTRNVVDLVNESLVIDMLHPIKIDMAPVPMTPQLAAEYKSSGINAILHGIGLSGPDARDQVLSFYALWGHYVQVNSDVFTGVDMVTDIIRAKREGKVTVIMGMQNSDHFRKVEDVEFFFKLGQRVLS